MSDIAWNLKALSDDAKAWSCVSDHLNTASQLAEDATVTQGDFMAFLPSSASAQAAVTSAVDRLKAMALDGSKRTGEGADVLLEVRDAYRDNEAAARETYDGLWEPEEN